MSYSREKMNESKNRKLAAFISLVVAAGIFGVIAITINLGTFAVFMEVLRDTPQLMFVLFAGVVSLGIGIALLTKIEFSKKAILATLILSLIIFAIAAIQMSIVLGFVLFWPWSLYKLYKNESA
jgi:hypothetical protein